MSPKPSSSTSSTRMVRQRNPTDRILGSFANVSPNPNLDHVIRYLSTWSGTDKALMFTQYSSKLVVALLTLQHALRIRLQQGTKGYRSIQGGGTLAKKVQTISSLISDARMLYRIWGILPIIKMMIHLERSPPATRLLHNIERIQGWSMLIYCPMEAIAYLASHQVVSLSSSSQNRLWLYSSRAWALYVGLQLLHLVEDNRLLRLRARALERTRGHPAPIAPPQKQDSEKKSLSVDQIQTRRLWDELDDRKEAILNEFWVNLGYLPLTLHWSLASGLFNDAWVGLFGTIAATAGLRSGWKRTALPPDAPTA